MQPGNKPSTMVLVTFTVLLALNVAAAEGSSKDSYSRYLLQAAAATPAAMPGAAAMPAMTNTTMAPANATGNATDDRSRRGGGPGGGGGDGRGATGSTLSVYCGSISCLRRKLFQTPPVTTTPAAANTTAMPGTDAAMAPANATGNATDDRARRGGGPGGGDGDGRGNTGSTRAVYCGSISCLRRKLFQAPAVSTAPATAAETTPAATPAAAPAAATNGLGMLNATMNGTLAGVNITNGTEADRSRRRNSCSEGACGPPAPRTEFGV